MIKQTIEKFSIFHGTKAEYVQSIIDNGINEGSWFGELYHALRVTKRKNGGEVAVLRFEVTGEDVDFFYGRTENVWRNKRRLYPVAVVKFTEERCGERGD